MTSQDDSLEIQIAGLFPLLERCLLEKCLGGIERTRCVPGELPTDHFLIGSLQPKSLRLHTPQFEGAI